ncbi:MAG TPA: hypothetical protein VFZ47_11690, partial [Chitinophagaceae bacterium]
NVGIGTSAPQKKLTVNGSIMLDQGNQNAGSLDSAALLFGSVGDVGITSRKIGAGVAGLSFWTGGNANFNIGGNGNIGIGGAASGSHRLYVYNGNSYFDGNITGQGSLSALTNAAIGGNPDAAYRLRVYDGASRFGGDLHATGNVAFGGDVDANFRLRVWGGNSRFGGDLYATGSAAVGGEIDNNFRFKVMGGDSRFLGGLSTSGSVAINGDIDNSFKLRVYGGPSRFGGDVEVTGEMNTGTLTIGGNGSVRSNGSSPLRIGFDQKTVDVFINNNAAVSVTANITDFAGDNDDVRVFVAQVVNDPTGAISWSKVSITVMGVDAATNTCLLWLHNNGGGSSILRGTIYLTTIAKN